MEALRRVKANTVEKRLLADGGNPAFHLEFYILNARGEYAGVTMYSSFRGQALKYSICTENGPQTLPTEGLLGEAPVEP